LPRRLEPLAYRMRASQPSRYRLGSDVAPGSSRSRMKESLPAASAVRKIPSSCSPRQRGRERHMFVYRRCLPPRYGVRSPFSPRVLPWAVIEGSGGASRRGIAGVRASPPSCIPSLSSRARRSAARSFGTFRSLLHSATRSTCDKGEKEARPEPRAGGRTPAVGRSFRCTLPSRH